MGHSAHSLPQRITFRVLKGHRGWSFYSLYNGIIILTTVRLQTVGLWERNSLKRWNETFEGHLILPTDYFPPIIVPASRWSTLACSLLILCFRAWISASLSTISASRRMAVSLVVTPSLRADWALLRALSTVVWALARTCSSAVRYINLARLINKLRWAWRLRHTPCQGSDSLLLLDFIALQLLDCSITDQYDPTELFGVMGDTTSGRKYECLSQI